MRIRSRRNPFHTSSKRGTGSDMKHLVLMLVATAAATPAMAQTSTDVVVMRQKLAAPRPVAATTPKPATSCETPAGSRWTGRFINGNTTYRTHTRSIASYAELATACEALYKQYGVGACFLSASSTGGQNSQFIYPANALYYEQYAWTTFTNRPDLIGANCGQ
jgi:hypothetical protein